MRIFVSFNSRDTALAAAVRAGLSRIEPGVQIFFSSVALGAGFWLPKLAEEIAQAESFLLLIGPNGIGPWQEVEYFTAFDRHVKDKRFAPPVRDLLPRAKHLFVAAIVRIAPTSGVKNAAGTRGRLKASEMPRGDAIFCGSGPSPGRGCGPFFQKTLIFQIFQNTYRKPILLV
jgi:hypothetical protein